MFSLFLYSAGCHTSFLVYSICTFCRLSHFDYVKPEDLEKVGMAKPAIRRLLGTVRKRKTKIKKKGIIQKVITSELIVKPYSVGFQGEKGQPGSHCVWKFNVRL